MAKDTFVLAHKGDFGSYAIFYQGPRYAIFMRVKVKTLKVI